MIELTKRFGVRPRLTWYDTYVTVDNSNGRDASQRQGARRNRLIGRPPRRRQRMRHWVGCGLYVRGR